MLKKSCKAMHKTSWTLRRTTSGRCTVRQYGHLVQWRSSSRHLAVFEDLWNTRTQLPPGALRSELGNMQAWLARFSARWKKTNRKEEDSVQEQLQRTKEAVNQVPSRVSPADWLFYAPATHHVYGQRREKTESYESQLPREDRRSRDHISP